MAKSIVNLLSVAALAAALAFPAAHAGPGKTDCQAASDLEDYFMLKTAPAYRPGDCPVLSALAKTAELLGERDFPNTQARVEPLKTRNYEKSARLALKSASGKRRDVACRALLDIAAKTDETMVHHAIEMVVLIDGPDGACTKRLGGVLRPDQKPAEVLSSAAELCVARKEPHCADLLAQSKQAR